MIFSAQELLRELSGGPAPVRFSVFGEQVALVLDLASVVDDDGARRLAAWLPSLACPVIGLAEHELLLCRQGAATVCAATCDVVVAEAAELDWLLQKIEARPVTAACFVELLRRSEGLPVEIGLAMESSQFACLQGGAEYAAWLRDRPVAKAVPQDSGPAVLLRREGSCLQMTLNRPSSRNAMSVEMRDALVEALRMVWLDDSLAEVHLSGAGRSFSTGGELREFGQVPDAASGHLIRLLSVPGRFLAPVAARVRAYVHGACVGSGIEFPAFAGRVVAHPEAWFQLPEIGMGLIPGAGGCISMARRIGRQRLAWMGLSGKRVRAPQALAWGLIDEIS